VSPLDTPSRQADYVVCTYVRTYIRDVYSLLEPHVATMRVGLGWPRIAPGRDRDTSHCAFMYGFTVRPFIGVRGERPHMTPLN